MSDDLDSILEALRAVPPLARAPVVERLRRDGALLDRLHAHAEDQGAPPAVLLDLYLERHGGRLVRAFQRNRDLEIGMWLLPQLERPGHDFQREGGAILDAMAARHQDVADPAGLARILAEDYGFGGDLSDYHHPRNSYLDQVLERRMGLPLTLTGLWLLLCQRIGLSAWAVALPGHVVGGWDGGHVDPFNGGRELDTHDLDAIARAAGYNEASSLLMPAQPHTLLQRMALNVSVGYRQRGDPVRTVLATAMGRMQGAPE